MIKLKFLKRKNPRDLTAPEKYYAAAVTDGSTDLKELAEMVASQSTVSPADCYAVLTALESNVIRELRQGRIVKLGELGSYRLSVASEGRDTVDEVSTTMVKRTKILFRPGKGLRNMLKTLDFKKVQIA